MGPILNARFIRFVDWLVRATGAGPDYTPVTTIDDAWFRFWLITVAGFLAVFFVTAISFGVVSGYRFSRETNAVEHAAEVSSSNAAESRLRSIEVRLNRLEGRDR